MNDGGGIKASWGRLRSETCWTGASYVSHRQGNKNSKQKNPPPSDINISPLFELEPDNHPAARELLKLKFIGETPLANHTLLLLTTATTTAAAAAAAAATTTAHHVISVLHVNPALI